MLSIILARRLGLEADALLFIVTSLGLPNPHVENLDVVEAVAKSLGLPLVVARPPRKGVDEYMASLLRRLGAKAVVAGDILVEDHVEWWRMVAESAGARLVEPLYGLSTRRVYGLLELYGVEWRVIGAKPGLHEEIIGACVARGKYKSFLDVLSRLGVDPVGEYGEYHTIATNSPLHRAGPLTLARRSLIDASPYMIIERVATA